MIGNSVLQNESHSHSFFYETYKQSSKIFLMFSKILRSIFSTTAGWFSLSKKTEISHSSTDFSYNCMKSNQQEFYEAFKTFLSLILKKSCQNSIEKANDFNELKNILDPAIKQAFPDLPKMEKIIENLRNGSFANTKLKIVLDLITKPDQYFINHSKEFTELKNFLKFADIADHFLKAYSTENEAIAKISHFFAEKEQLTLDAKPVARGAQGAVYLLKDKDGDVKFVFKFYDSSYKQSEKLKKAIKLASQIVHPQAITAIKLICKENDDITSCLTNEDFIKGHLLGVILPYVEGITLSEASHKIRKQPINETLQLLLNLTKTMEAMHDAGVEHGDLHMKNIMVNTNQSTVTNAVIIDFDFATPFTIHNIDDEYSLIEIIYSLFIVNPHIKKEQCEFLQACLKDYSSRITQNSLIQNDLGTFLKQCIDHLTEIVKPTSKL